MFARVIKSSPVSFHIISPKVPVHEPGFARNVNEKRAILHVGESAEHFEGGRFVGHIVRARRVGGPEVAPAGTGRPACRIQNSVGHNVYAGALNGIGCRIINVR